MPRYTIGELHSPEFNNRYFFDGTLGALHAADGTTFRLWAPTAWRVVLNVHSGPAAGTYPMTPDQPHPGVWECRLSGDQDGAEYTYTLCSKPAVRGPSLSTPTPVRSPPMGSAAS